MDIQAVVRESIQAVAPYAKIQEHALLKEDLGIDSLNLVQLILAVEEALQVTINTSDLDPEKWKTVQDVRQIAERYAG